LYGSIKSAIPENPLLGANICGLSAVEAELSAIFGQKFGESILGVRGPKSKIEGQRFAEGFTDN